MSLWLRRAFVLGAGLAVALTSAANAGEYNVRDARGMEGRHVVCRGDGRALQAV